MNFIDDYEIRERVGKFIEVHRTARKITQNQLAEGIGVTRRTVINWESGEMLPKLPDVIRILSFLGEDEKIFFAEISGKRKPNRKQEKVVSLVRNIQDESLLDLLYDFIGGLNKRTA